MSANKDAASSSTAGQSGKDVSGKVQEEKSVDKLNVREFCERFCIPNGVSIQLVDGEAVSTEKSADNAIYFTKEQFNDGLRFPLPSLFKEFLHVTQIPSTYVHPNMVRVLMGCSILSMLFNLDLSLLEVLFAYSIKKGKNDIYSFVANLPSLQLVTSLPNLTKGAARGHMLVKGLWGGLSVHPDRQFPLNHSLKTPGKDIRGKLVEWVEKASFDRLNRLFEIAADERSCETLLSAQNLCSVTQEPQPGAKGRRLGTQALLNERRKEGKKGLCERPLVINAPHPLLLLAPQRERRRSNLSVSATLFPSGRGCSGVSCAETLPPMAPPMEETRAEKQGLPPCELSSLALVPVKGPATRRSRPARDLKSSISGWLQDPLLETIEVNCSSAQENHPKGSETEMVEDNPTDPMLVSDEGSPEKIQPAVNDGGPEPGRSHTLVPRQRGVPLMMHLH
ncbi:hypothetical protein CK203_044050 [Vitis vinifera]|uniref:Uncharacterized protein n=1 Tax=Vitis vinifera TaxID=29760 RepID=A0A438HM97_VITVI|nr:hypothetical protein CK203_044050 [Vitis vinifera]